MKIRNWLRKIPAALFAAGIFVPGVAYAVDHPLGDPSFETFVVPALGYAYANTYRVGANASAWVDDLDSPPGYTQDNVASAWLYNSTFMVAPGCAANGKSGVARVGQL